MKLPGLIQKSIDQLEEEMKEWLDEQMKDFSFPDSLEIKEDIPYLADEKDCHRMDVYYPQSPGEGGKHPVIFDFHGGGLLSCSRKHNRIFCTELAKRGFVVFCIDYPLVPHAYIYEILRDSYAGIRAAFEHAASYGGDPERVYLCGDSAGGFIATYLAAIQNNPEIARSLSIETDRRIRIRGLIAISAMFYSGRIDHQKLFLMRPFFYGKGFKSHPFHRYVNPESREVIRALPELLAITSRRDYLGDYTRRYVRILKKAGHPLTLFDFYDNDSLSHDFVVLKPQEKESSQVLDEIARFANEQFR